MTDTDITHHLFAALEQRSEAIAYVFEGETMTWAELDTRARSYAAALSNAGVGKGDRVAVKTSSCLELIVALFGHYYLGAIHVPINTRYRVAEVAHILRDSRPSVVVGDLDGSQVLDDALGAAELAHAPMRVGIGEGVAGFQFSELLEAAPGDYSRPGGSDPALMIYTSGTTGPSKGVLHTHASIISNMRALTGLWTWSKTDRLVLALPLFHVHGLCIGVHGAALHGMCVLLESRFDPAAVIERFGDQEHGQATLFMGVPTMYAAIVEYLEARPKAAATLARGRLFCSGSAALSADLWRRFMQLTGQRILERYGMSETLITLTNPYLGERTPGAVGRPVPGCDAAVIDEQGDEVPVGEMGELIVYSNGIMASYWNLPEHTSAAFVEDRDGRRWFATGDVAQVDELGYFHIVGRKSVDIIKSGGFKISAREIEDVLAGHAMVNEVAIVGIEDPKWGQKIVACVSLSEAAPEDPTLVLEALVEAHQKRLADFKKPRGLHVCASLPRNALGKLQKHMLIDTIMREGLAAESEPS